MWVTDCLCCVYTRDIIEMELMKPCEKKSPGKTVTDFVFFVVTENCAKIIFTILIVCGFKGT